MIVCRGICVLQAGSVDEFQAVGLGDGVELNRRRFGGEFHEDEQLLVDFGAKMEGKIGFRLPEADKA
jgi:hypothetical protein